MSPFNGYSVISGTVTLIELFSMNGRSVIVYQRDARMNIAVYQVNHAS